MTEPIEQTDREIIAGILHALFQGKKTITYGELANSLRDHVGRDLNPHVGFNIPLGRIQDYCLASGVPCLSAVVVSQSGNPGSGFAEYYREVNPSDIRTDNEILRDEQTRCSEQADWSPLLAYCAISQELLDCFDAKSLDYDLLNWTQLVSIIDQYESAMASFRPEELYKWEAAKCFQEHWDIDASDFPGMLEASLAQTDNLLLSFMYYAGGMIQGLARNDPESARASFCTLFDENIPLADRLEHFSSDMDRQLEALNDAQKKNGETIAKNHYQDAHAMSVYLALERNSEHYLYKADLLTVLANMVGYQTTGKSLQRVVDYERLCDLILDYLETRRLGLVAKSNELLSDDLKSVDPKQRLLVQDIVYFAKQCAARNWSYAPGEQARHWDDLYAKGVMAIGWDKIGDPQQFKTKKDLRQALEAEYKKDNASHDANTIWSFIHSVKPGDVIWVRQGLTTVIARGVVKSDYRYEPKRPYYPSVRDVEWERFEPFNTEKRFSRQTLCELTEKTTVTVSSLEKLATEAITPCEVPNGSDSIEPPVFPGESEKRYWWLTANPNIWSLSNTKPGEEQSYTIYTENGAPRRIHSNFLHVQKGDIVVGYEASPVKKIVSLCEISRDTDDTSIYFKKVRDFFNPISYSDIRTDNVLCESQFVKNPNGSLFALTKTQFDRVLELADVDDPVANVSKPEPYDDAALLEEVFVSEDALNTMKRLLSRKKNLILQGAPGTGKTFCARRLAWNVMGEKDDSRICLVQFHQNTTYDDMIAGYRPSEDGGFEAIPGNFLRFCERAAGDPERPWFFIIDEINRANISKVFGELLMLIEASHRGERVQLPLLNRSISVPENLYLIGMMNTADRGLALIDYALRRRFAFFEMEPAFGNERFKTQVERAENSKLTELVKRVETLNDRIADDPSLGTGFRIGHSYFCGDGAMTDDEVRDIVAYELAPLLQEYWFDEPDTARIQIEKLEAVL